MPRCNTRLTAVLPEEAKARAVRHASRFGMSESAFVRRAVLVACDKLEGDAPQKALFELVDADRVKN